MFSSLTKHMLRPRSLLLLCICILELATLLSGCQQTGARQENRYLSAIWSPDGRQTAYFRRHLEYQTSSGKYSFFIGEESHLRRLMTDQLFLCINDADGKHEQVVSEITYPLFQPDIYTIPDIFTNIVWEGQTILYGGGARDWFASGVHRFDLATKQDVQVEPGFDPVITLGHTQLRKEMDGRQLYSSEDGGYGQINNRVIFLFDHNQRTVAIYLSDPSITEPVKVPPYSITNP